MSEAKLIDGISDTARWVAYYRAEETDRPDALFRDPLARRLAGDRGEAIVRELPGGRNMTWALVVRTCVLDELILQALVKDGVDTVLNLAAGLDTRPYRLPLTKNLRWIEVDFPELLAYKERTLRDQVPRCRLERVPVDLLDVDKRRAFFARIGRESQKTLVITEGLLVYLPEAQVASLAHDLASVETFKLWALDFVSPAMLRRVERRWGKVFARGNSVWHWGVEDAPVFFAQHGWRERDTRYIFDEARRLNREMPYARLVKLLAALSPAKVRATLRKYAGYALLER